MTIHLYRYRRHLLAGISVCCFLVATPASAAQFRVEAPNGPVAPGSQVTVSVYLNTQAESINAVGGTLSIPTALEVASVRDDGSIIPMWIEAPKASVSGSISFSGITPGGYNGERGLLFTVTLRTKSEGSESLSLSELQAFLNDGKGTSARVSSAQAKIVVSTSAPVRTTAEKIDTTPPEPFTIQIIQTPDAFDGKRVLIFATQDKGSGISHYKICEGLVGSCVVGENSYVLRQQSADRLITVIAFDNSGNARTERLFTSASIIRYALYAIVAILVGVIAGFLLFRNRDA